MLRFSNKLGWLAALMLGSEPVLGFSLLGPPEAYQTRNIGYMLQWDLGGPMNLGEEYRWNTPVINYAFDQSFLDYFGSNGVYAVEQAIALLNSSLTNLTSADHLNEFPMEGMRVNYRAQQLHLYDLKSHALQMTLEELGLASPDRYVWTLRNREPIPGGAGCPDMWYAVAMRNYDPLTFDPSPYVNGNLFTYKIKEQCAADTRGVEAWAVTLPADPDSHQYSAVMSDVASWGVYWNTLTRDDVGGIRYMLRTNNVNYEALSSDSSLFITNTTMSQLLYTSNLTEFAYQAMTTNAAALQGLYPNLVILYTTNWFVPIWITNITAYYTNYPFDPVGSYAHVAYATNRTAAVQTLYRHTFGNLARVVYTNGSWRLMGVADPLEYSNRTYAAMQTVYTTNSPWSPAGYGTLTTNYSFTRFATNMIVGEYVILPTNSCDAIIVGDPVITVTNVYTNVLISATNTIEIVDTNTITGTNQAVQFLSQNLITYSTNHVFVMFPVECGLTNGSDSLRSGMDRIHFERSNFDSLLGVYYTPITNQYEAIVISNSIASRQVVQRIVTRPDLLYRAADQNDSLLSRTSARRTVPNWVKSPSALVGNLAGPGTINVGGGSNVVITFNKVGPVIENFYSSNLSDNTQATGRTNFMWGSFDGSSKDPIVYPNGTSIADLESQIFFQIVSGHLMDGEVGQPYSDQLQVNGGSAPYAWYPTPGSAPMPSGLSLSSSGVVSGTPQAQGTYWVTVTVADSNGQNTSRSVTIVIR